MYGPLFDTMLSTHICSQVKYLEMRRLTAMQGARLMGETRLLPNQGLLNQIQAILFDQWPNLRIWPVLEKTLVPILLISVPSFSCFPGSAPVPPANTPTQSFVNKREPQHQPATQFIVYIIQRDQLSRRTNQTNSKSCDKSPQPHNANRKPPLK